MTLPGRHPATQFLPFLSLIPAHSDGHLTPLATFSHHALADLCWACGELPGVDVLRLSPPRPPQRPTPPVRPRTPPHSHGTVTRCASRATKASLRLAEDSSLLLSSCSSFSSLSSILCDSSTALRLDHLRLA